MWRKPCISTVHVRSEAFMYAASTPPLRSQVRDVSPPPSSVRKRPRLREHGSFGPTEGDQSHHNASGEIQVRKDPPPRASTKTPLYATPAAVESGEAKLADHLDYYTRLFTKIRTQRARTRTVPSFRSPPLSVSSLSRLYTENAGSCRGRHFVIHQHDHPRAGLHYDLRLQFSETSSASWSVNKGLPGNANESVNHGPRQAIETRVHPLWTHLNESASLKSGSQLIWDTGVYEILPYRDDEEHSATDDEGSSGNEVGSNVSLSEPERFQHAFLAKRIRIRLHGSRLPPGYTIRLRYSESTENKIRRGLDLAPRSTMTPLRIDKATLSRHASRKSKPDTVGVSSAIESDASIDEASDGERENKVDEWIRANNAYPGSENTIGSVRGRSWIIYLDHKSCGFRKKRRAGTSVWENESSEMQHQYPFLVRGREVETSVVTGRTAKEVLEDEGVTTYIPKAGWVPILK